MTDIVIHTKELVLTSLNYLNHITPSQWEAIGTAIGASGILSPALMAVKKFLKVERDLVMFGLVILACFTVVGVAYIKGAVHVNPVLATTLLTVITNILYYAIFKPLKNYYAPRLAARIAQVRLLNQAKKVSKAIDEAVEDVPGKLTSNSNL